MNQNEEFNGKNGTLILTPTGIIIKRGVFGMLLGAGRGEKNIPYSSITAVQFKKPGLMSGYLQLTLRGGIEHTGGALSAERDENTVTFNPGKTKQFLRAKEIIENQILNANQPTSKVSNMDELEKLSNLHDKGIINDDEFNAKKKQLLGL